MASVNWLCTLNNPDFVDYNNYLEKWITVAKATYVVGQLERGENGTPHLQYFVNFKKPGQRMSFLKKYCSRSHFLSVKVNNGADLYCMKEDTRLEGPWEFGSKPVKRNSKTDWDSVKKLAQANKLDEIPADIYVRHIFALEHIAKKNLKAEERKEPKVCMWYWGDSGSGKTRKATTDYPDHYKKLANKWWDAYQGQKAVILDDLPKKTAEALNYHLKLWADPWNNNPGEVKGGMIMGQFDVFIVTSNYHPAQIWTEAEELDPILRRFEVKRINRADLQGPLPEAGDNQRLPE